MFPGTSAASVTDDGCIFYDISASQDVNRPALFPFETNSSYQVILGLIDGERIENSHRALSGDSGEGSHDVPSILESIIMDFSREMPSTPEVVVRQLVYCGSNLSIPLSLQMAHMPESNDDGAALEIMVKISKEFTDGVVTIAEGLRDQPISMVPGGNLQMPRRAGNTPNPADEDSTPVSTKSPSPMHASNEPEPQVCPPL